jgi:hypothetical protein
MRLHRAENIDSPENEERGPLCIPETQVVRFDPVLELLV